MAGEPGETEPQHKSQALHYKRLPGTTSRGKKLLRDGETQGSSFSHSHPTLHALRGPKGLGYPQGCLPQGKVAPNSRVASLGHCQVGLSVERRQDLYEFLKTTQDSQSHPPSQEISRPSHVFT